jgi:hypothetical protein
MFENRWLPDIDYILEAQAAREAGQPAPLQPLLIDDNAKIEAEADRVGILPEHKARVIRDLKVKGLIVPDGFTGQPISKDRQPMSAAFENYATSNPECAPETNLARLPGVLRTVKTKADLAPRKKLKLRVAYIRQFGYDKYAELPLK